jgi:hypothetical protein
MEKRSGAGCLGHSTAARIINRQTLPADRDQPEAFLHAIDLQ